MPRFNCYGDNFESMDMDAGEPAIAAADYAREIWRKYRRTISVVVVDQREAFAVEVSSVEFSARSIRKAAQ